MADHKLEIKIGGKLDASLQAAATQAQKILNSLKRGTGAMVKGYGVAMGTIGAGAALAGKNAISSGMALENAMTELAGVSGVDIGSEAYIEMEEAARQVGATTNKSSAEAVQALKYMSLAGWSTTDSMAALHDMVQLSSVSGMELARTSDLVTDSMGALNLGMDEYAGYMDMVAKADTAANYSSEQLMETLLGSGGAARVLGVQLNELSTAAGILANNGIKGSEAGTALNSVFARLAGNDKALSTLEGLNIELYDAQDNFIGLKTFLEQTDAALASMDASSRNQTMKDLFGTHYLSDMEYLMTSVRDGGEAWDSLSQSLQQSYEGMDEAGTAVDTLSERYSKATDNLQGDMDILKSSWASFGEDLYKGMVGDVDTGLRGMVESMTEYVGQLKEAFSSEGLGGIGTEIGTIMTDIATQINEGGATAVEAAGTFVSNIFESLAVPENSATIGAAAAKIVTELGEQFMSTSVDYAIAAGSLMEGLANGLTDANAGTTLATALAESLSDLGTYLEENGASLGEAAGALLAQLAQGIADNADQILVAGINIAQGLLTGLIKGAAVLVANLPSIIASIVSGIAAAIPNFVQAGAALGSALLDGLKTAGAGIAGFFEEAFTTSESIPLSIDAQAYLDTNLADINAQILSGIDTGEYEGRFGGLTADAEAYFSALASGTSTVQELEAAMSEYDPSAQPYQDMAGAVDVYNMELQRLAEEGAAAMAEATADSQAQAQEMAAGMQEAVGGISEATQQMATEAMSGLDDMASAQEGVDAAFESLKESVTGSMDGIQEAMDTEISSDALSAVIESIDAGTITEMSASLAEAMSSMSESANTAAADVGMAFSGMSATVQAEDAVITASVQATASAIPAAFSAIDLSGIATSMMAGLTAGIQSAGAEAVAAAQSVASQVASAMSSALQIHSPSKVTYAIGEFAGMGLVNALEDSEGDVYDASASLAEMAGSGMGSGMTSGMAGAKAPAAGGGGGAVTFAPQITITGNASEADVRNALTWGMEQFERMYDRLSRDRGRMAYA